MRKMRDRQGEERCLQQGHSKREGRLLGCGYSPQMEIKKKNPNTHKFVDTMISNVLHD